MIVKELLRNRITYPGPDNIVHAWAYLPDLADTAVRLAEARATLGPFETFGFPGHALTGSDLVAAIESAMGQIYNARRMSWWMVRTVGRLTKVGRELAEFEYLWKMPHRIDGSRLQAAIGGIPHTPLDKAIARSLRELGYRPKR